jgi:hypothetical protein
MWDVLKCEKGGEVKDSDFDDVNTRKLLQGLRDRLHDEIAMFLCDHPEVPPAVVGSPFSGCFSTTTSLVTRMIS